MSRLFRLMVVDDSASDCLLVKEALNHPGKNCDVTLSHSGQEALTTLTSSTVLPDVLLLDINMPGMNGLEVLSALKDLPQLRGVPVVMFSTSDKPEDIAEAYSRHANSYLVKPVDFSGFEEQLDTLLNFWSSVMRTHPT